MSKTINKTEKKIVKILIENQQEFTCYEITKKVYETKDVLKITNKSNFIYKNINNLLRKNVVLKKKSYPVFYRINQEIAKDFQITTNQYEVSCTHCEKKLWIYEFQQTKQCSCLKPNGENRRFWITKKVYTGEKKFV